MQCKCYQLPWGKRMIFLGIEISVAFLLEVWYNPLQRIV